MQRHAQLMAVCWRAGAKVIRNKAVESTFNAPHEVTTALSAFQMNKSGSVQSVQQHLMLPDKSTDRCCKAAKKSYLADGGPKMKALR